MMSGKKNNVYLLCGGRNTGILLNKSYEVGLFSDYFSYLIIIEILHCELNLSKAKRMKIQVAMCDDRC
jgi:hypothetical protein